MTSEVKPYYDATQCTMLTARFGEESIPLLEAAARALDELKREPPGITQQCDRYRCHATRVRMIHEGRLYWVFIDADGDGADEDHCIHGGEGEDHKWRKLKEPSPY